MKYPPQIRIAMAEDLKDFLCRTMNLDEHLERAYVCGKREGLNKIRALARDPDGLIAHTKIERLWQTIEDEFLEIHNGPSLPTESYSIDEIQGSEIERQYEHLCEDYDLDSPEEVKNALDRMYRLGGTLVEPDETGDVDPSPMMDWGHAGRVIQEWLLSLHLM